MSVTRKNIRKLKLGAKLCSVSFSPNHARSLCQFQFFFSFRSRRNTCTCTWMCFLFSSSSTHSSLTHTSNGSGVRIVAHGNLSPCDVPWCSALRCLNLIFQSNGEIHMNSDTLAPPANDVDIGKYFRRQQLPDAKSNTSFTVILQSKCQIYQLPARANTRRSVRVEYWWLQFADVIIESWLKAFDRNAFEVRWRSDFCVRDRMWRIHANGTGHVNELNVQLYVTRVKWRFTNQELMVQKSNGRRGHSDRVDSYFSAWRSIPGAHQKSILRLEMQQKCRRPTENNINCPLATPSHEALDTPLPFHHLFFLFSTISIVYSFAQCIPVSGYWFIFVKQ